MDRAQEVEPEPGRLDILDAVVAENGDVTLAQERQATGVQAGLPRTGSDRVRSLGQDRLDVAGVDQERIARSHPARPAAASAASSSSGVTA